MSDIFNPPCKTTDLQAHPSPHIGFLDTTFENEHESATHTSSSLSPIDPRNPGEEPLTTKPSTAEEKTKKFPKFKFSLTAPPPKSKPKQPGQGPPAVVSCPLLKIGCSMKVLRTIDPDPGAFPSTSVAVVAQEILSG